MQIQPKEEEKKQVAEDADLIKHQLCCLHSTPNTLTTGKLAAVHLQLPPAINVILQMH